MTLAPLRTTIALAALLTAVAAPTWAVEPLPAGYERMMFPTSNFEFVFRELIAENSTAFGSFTPGHRIIDLEVEWFDSEPNWDDYDKGIPNHVVTLVEVPNLGPFHSYYSSWAIGLTEAQLQKFLGNELRPIDIELYYRKDPYSGDLTATYAVVAVDNWGKDYAEWDWIPPTPYHSFMTLLDQRHAEGWRPYDIEFAVDGFGQVVGTALLARNWGVVTGRNEERPVPLVPTIWKWFDPLTEPLLDEEGWQLLDVEVPPLVKDGPAGTFDFGTVFPRYREAGFRFGIFVNTDFVKVEEETYTWMDTDAVHSGDWNGTIPLLQKELAGEARLIDIELDGEIPNCSGSICEAPTLTYTHVWLSQD